MGVPSSCMFATLQCAIHAFCNISLEVKEGFVEYCQTELFPQALHDYNVALRQPLHRAKRHVPLSPDMQFQ